MVAPNLGPLEQGGPAQRQDAVAGGDARDQQIADLTAALRARDDFIAVAAHELRNPMAPMFMLVQMLRAAIGPAEAPDRVTTLLDRLQWSIRNFSRRSAVLLDVSRITSGRLLLDAAEIPLSELARETAASLAPIVEVSGSTVTLEVEEGVTCVGDRIALEQIADNLLSNAIKYGRGRPILLRVSAAEGVARLQVSDQGEGIPDAARALIFEPFTRVVTEGRRHGGFGVGLWVVHQLTQAMQGRVTVTSTPEDGSTFTVTLPCARRETTVAE